jgi:hypothetical protein
MKADGIRHSTFTGKPIKKSSSFRWIWKLWKMQLWLEQMLLTADLSTISFMRPKQLLWQILDI